MSRIKRACIRPTKSLDLLSHRELEGLGNADEQVFQLFRQCVLAVLNTGSHNDDATQMLEEFADFQVKVIPQSRGIKLEVTNAPENAFVDGQMMRSIQDHVFSVLRDIVFTDHKINRGSIFDLESREGLTDAVFRILRNAHTVRPNEFPNMIVCWGGHSIDRLEYEYSKEVGYRLGLRGMNIATGCGTGAMKGPMKGARVGHAKQKNLEGRYVGISEPGILASEPPNPVVNELVILPDIEKRLEAFVRVGHAIVVFPGGPGTAEEVMYMLSILMRPENKDIPFPLIFTAPEEKVDYFDALDQFIVNTLGEEARQYYTIVNNDPIKVSRLVRQGVEQVVRFRRRTQAMYGFNWELMIPYELQQPFIPSHENMAALKVSRDMPAYELAANLRAVFSGIVAGNVKPYGQQQIAKYGPYELKGDASLMKEVDALLTLFVEQGRMKIGGHYQPCYRIH